MLPTVLPLSPERDILGVKSSPHNVSMGGAIPVRPTAVYRPRIIQFISDRAKQRSDAATVLHPDVGRYVFTIVQLVDGLRHSHRLRVTR